MLDQPTYPKSTDTGKAVVVETRIGEAELERLLYEVIPCTSSADKASKKESVQKAKLIKKGYHSLIKDANAIIKSVAEDQGVPNRRSWHHNSVSLFKCISDPFAGTRLMEASKGWRSFIPDRLPKPFFMIENVIPPILLSQLDSDKDVISVDLNFNVEDGEYTRRYPYRNKAGPSYVVIGMELFPKTGESSLVQGPKALRSREYAEEDETKWAKLYAVMGKRSEKEVMTQFKKDCASGDSGVSASSIVVSLRCPVSLGPLINPVRGIKCRHLQCSELSSLTSSTSANSKRYKCPICQQSYGIEDIFEDGLAKAMLKKYPGADEIIIDASNGTFKPKYHTTGHSGHQYNSRDSPSDGAVNLTETADDLYSLGPVQLEFYPIKKDPYAGEEPRNKSEEPNMSNPTNLVVIDEDSQKSPLDLEQSQKAIELD